MAAGVSSGFLNGLAGMAGPPIAFYYLAGQENAAHVRANLTTYFVFVDLVAIATFASRSLIDWNTVVFSALIIKGVYGREMYETWYKMTAMIQSGLDISPVITHRFPYTEFKEAIELMKSGNSGKVVLNWSEL